MKPPDDQRVLRHMLEHAREAVAMVEGHSREDLDTDRQLELALTRLIEIIGEAATKTSDRCRENLAAIPWPQIIGMRHRLIHAYDRVDLQILWDTIQVDLPPLIRELDKALGDVDPIE